MSKTFVRNRENLAVPLLTYNGAGRDRSTIMEHNWGVNSASYRNGFSDGPYYHCKQHTINEPYKPVIVLLTKIIVYSIIIDSNEFQAHI